MQSLIEKYVFNHSDILINSLSELKIKVPQSLLLIKNSLRKNKKILVAGNGGSASDSIHFAAEMAGKFKSIKRKPFSCISLSENISTVTAIANDFDFTKIFSRQILAYGNKGDVFIGISTSGKSSNILEAVKIARSLGLKIIILTGKKELSLSNKCDVCVNIQSLETSHIQEMHIIILHLFCEFLEKF
jgi:D-sedoheptulose 7-phosphate isomerase